MKGIFECVRSYRRFLPIAVIVLGGATHVCGQPALQAENLLIAQPAGFKVGYQANKDDTAISEWVPEGQSVDAWTQMLTVQVYRGAKVEAATFLQGVGKKWSDACPGSTGKGIFTGQTNGYVVSMLVLRCPKNLTTGKPETTAFRVIKGNDALYSVQRAFRSEPSDAELDDVMHYLAKVSVCDTRAPDHPCPSLDSLVPK
jgi:hypothetical protein